MATRRPSRRSGKKHGHTGRPAKITRAPKSRVAKLISFKKG